MSKHYMLLIRGGVIEARPEVSAADSFKVTNLSDADLSLHHHVERGVERVIACHNLISRNVCGPTFLTLALFSCFNKKTKHFFRVFSWLPQVVSPIDDRLMSELELMRREATTANKIPVAGILSAHPTLLPTILFHSNPPTEKFYKSEPTYIPT